MKKIWLLAAAALAVGTLSAQDRKIAFSALPATAENFVHQHFLVADIASVWQDTDWDSTEYTVFFKNGVEVEFNGEGEWKEIKVRRGVVPERLIPTAILTEVQAHFVPSTIKELKRNLKNGRFKVELSDGRDLLFDKEGNFIGIDD